MAKIELLDQNTINKIAAGEVVERPSAVVKELIENAIDAGANAVTCEIKEGGISFIRITDNGSGIARDDIDTAFLRHATSKIKSVEDLFSVSSLGFRGEALASIASVAQVEVLTKTSKDLTGIRYCIEGGEKKSDEEIGCPNGTTFIVRNLFYNTPARRKFLKSATTEAGYINDLMMRLAVSHPEVSFKFINNSQIKLHTSGNNNLKDILYGIYGRDIANQLVEVNSVTEGIKLHGYIGKPLISRGNRTYENYYINGRYIRSSIICKAIEEAYKPYIMQHKYPFTAIHYEIDSDMIDVNVHPTKLEIRFRNGDKVFEATNHAINEALSTKEMIPEVTLTEEKEAKNKIQTAAEPFESNRLMKEQSPFFMNKKPKTSGLSSVSNVIEIKETNKLVKNGNTNTDGQNPQEEIAKTEIGKLNDVVNHAYEYGKQVLSHEVGQQVNNNFETTIQGNDNLNDAKSANSSEQLQIDMANSAVNTDPELSLFEKLRLKREALLKREQEEQVVKTTLQMPNANNSDSSITNNIESVSNQTIHSDGTVISSGGRDSNLHLSETTQESYVIGKQLDLFGKAQSELKTSNEEDSSVQSPMPFLSDEARKKHRIIGQLFDTYWIVQYEDKMFIIDQHAAHEKVLYEKTMKKVHEKEPMSQMIHPPIVLSLTMREEEVLKQHMQIFEKLGYEIEHFGGKEYSIRAVPCDLYNIANDELILQVIDQLVSDHYEKDAELILEKVASMSCKAAIKGNMRLSVQEADALIDQLLRLDNPYHCPHGRPVIISMSKYEIEKKFKRII